MVGLHVPICELFGGRWRFSAPVWDGDGLIFLVASWIGPKELGEFLTQPEDQDTCL